MPKKSETVLITGGLGQIGYYTYLQLRERYSICIIDNMSNAKVDAPEDVTFIKGDILDEEVYLQIPKVDYIVHTAAQISPVLAVSKPSFDAKTNIIGTLNLLEFARKIKLKRFVHISSAAVYGDPQFLPITEDHPKSPKSPYGVSKLSAENYVKLYSSLYKLDTVILVPFNAYSPLQKENDPYAGVIFKFLKAIQEGSPLLIEGDGLQTRDFIHVKDIAKAIHLSLEKEEAKNQIINIGTGNPVTIKDLASILLKLSKSSIEPKYVSPRKGDIYQSYCTINLSSKILTFSPSYTLEEGLTELYESIFT